MPLKKLIIQNVFWRGLYLLSTFILNIIISRYFKADGSGWIFFVINNLSLLLLVTGISLESGAVYYVSTNEIGTDKIATFCFVWAIFASLISVCLLLLFPQFFVSDKSIGYKQIIACFNYVLGFVLINYFTALFSAKQNFFIFNFILLVANIIILFLIVFLANSNFFFHKHFVLIYFSSFLFQGVAISIAFFFNQRINITWLPSKASLKNLVHYSMLALVANVIFFLVYRIDYWFVKEFCSPEALGNYIQVSKIGQIFLLVPSMIAAIIFPKTANDADRSLPDKMQTLSRILFSSYLVLIIMVSLFGKNLFIFIYGNTFSQMYLPFVLLSPGILVLSAQTLLSAYFAGKKKVKVNIAGSAIALAIIVVGDLILIPRFGIAAAAAVSTVGYICSLSYAFIIFHREHGGSIADFFFLKKKDLFYFKSYFQL